MSGFAFLILLAAFAAVAYWYASNVERQGEARKGWFAIKDDADIPSDEDAPKGEGVQALAAKVRARVRG